MSNGTKFSFSKSTVPWFLTSTVMLILSRTAGAAGSILMSATTRSIPVALADGAGFVPPIWCMEWSMAGIAVFFELLALIWLCRCFFISLPLLAVSTQAKASGIHLSSTSVDLFMRAKNAFSAAASSGDLENNKRAFITTNGSLSCSTLFFKMVATEAAEKSITLMAFFLTSAHGCARAAAIVASSSAFNPFSVQRA